MNIKHIVKLFEDGNVCVLGERGSGKDMLFANVIARRNLEYISNCEYPKKYGLPLKYNKLDFDKIDCGGNTYVDFMNDTVKPYTYPYPLGVDTYITDVGVYMPSQFCNELNKQYKHIPIFMALSRQIAEANVHINVQNLNRAWDKLREQSRTYITCLKCKMVKLGKHQLVVQKVRIYEKYDSCVSNVPPLRLPWYIHLGKDKMLARLYKLNYEIQHGKIKEATIVYFNNSDYNTHIFREMLSKAVGGDNICSNG